VTGEKEGSEGRKREDCEGRSVLFWNVAGLVRKDEEFWKYVGKFDFVSLEETWLDSKGWDKLKGWLPRTHVWKAIEARRENKRGRASGGMLIGKKIGWGNTGLEYWEQRGGRGMDISY